MRRAFVTLSTVAFALSTFAALESVSAKPAGGKTTLGCMIGKEKYDAGIGKCVPGKPVKMSSKAKKMAKKAM